MAKENIPALAATDESVGTKAEDAKDATSAKKTDATADEPDGDEGEPDGDKAKKASAGAQLTKPLAAATPIGLVSREDVKTIGTLCRLAGIPDKAADYLADGLSVAEVREKLNSMRAAESEEHNVSSVHNPGKVGGSIQALEAEAVAFARANKGVTKEQAYARMLNEHPEVYEAYINEHNTRAMRAQLSKLGVKLPA